MPACHHIKTAFIDNVSNVNEVIASQDAYGSLSLSRRSRARSNVRDA